MLRALRELVRWPWPLLYLGAALVGWFAPEFGALLRRRRRRVINAIEDLVDDLARTAARLVRLR